jgi:hypothetical protein
MEQAAQGCYRAGCASGDALQFVKKFNEKVAFFPFHAKIPVTVFFLCSCSLRGLKNNVCAAVQPDQSMLCMAHPRPTLRINYQPYHAKGRSS